MDDRERIIEAMEAMHSFPGYYPVTIIAREGEEFAASLRSAIMYEQDGDDFTISERHSSGKNYVSYKIELYVRTADIALQRKLFLSKLHGVLFLI